MGAGAVSGQWGRQRCRSRVGALGSAASRGPWCRLWGVPPPPAALGAAGGGRASGRVPSRQPAWLPPAPRDRRSGTLLGGTGELSACCHLLIGLLLVLNSKLPVSERCTCRSWRKGIETSRLVLIAFHLLREYVIFVWVCRDFPNLFCKSQMIQCSLVYVRIYNKAYDKVFLEINKNAFPRKQFIYGKMQVT